MLAGPPPQGNVSLSLGGVNSPPTLLGKEQRVRVRFPEGWELSSAWTSKDIFVVSCDFAGSAEVAYLPGTRGAECQYPSLSWCFQ